MSVQVRVESSDDEKEIGEVVTAAFTAGGARPGPEAALVRELRLEHRAFLPRFSLVALEDGVLVGHVMASRIRVGDAPALALAPLSVLPDRQGRGTGSLLIERVLQEATAAGETLVLVLGDPEFYRRFSFEVAGDLGITGPYSGETFMGLRLAADAPVGEAVYSPVFTRLSEGRL